MTFESISNLLQAIAKQPKWEKQRQYHQLVTCWRKIVNDKIAQNTRPLYVQREILWVATPNSVWAQNMTLQRYSLLKKINPLLDKPIVDIKFNSARWYKQDLSNVNDTSNLPSHPSSLNLDYSFSSDASSPVTSQEAFQRWRETIKKRSLFLVTCPKCSTPTPEGELKRWQMCCYCAAKTFAN